MTKGTLSGKHALVTGGLGSIGTAFVAGLAAAGARVTVLDRPDLAPPRGHGWLGVDLNDLGSVEAKVSAAGPFDILINNAALIINKPFQDFTLEEYDTQLRVNASASGVAPTAGLDPAAIRRIAVPVDFARLLYSTLQPGSSLLLTDEPINLDGVQNMTVLTDEPDTEHNAERP